MLIFEKYMYKDIFNGLDWFLVISTYFNPLLLNQLLAW